MRNRAVNGGPGWQPESDSLAERGEFELSGDFVKPFSKPLLLLVADEKLTGGQPLQRESQAQVIEHQALEFAGQ
jgi:hypothetical protein